MTTTTTDRPVRRPALDRETAMRLAAVEYSRYLDLVSSLDPEDWSRPTDCPAWDVRAMAGHNLGMAEMVATFPEMMRQNMAAARRAKKTGEQLVDAMTAIQVAEHAALSSTDLVARYASVGPRAARGRRRRPAFFRNARMPGLVRVGELDEPWVFGFVVDTILTRDCWMHRVDTSRATGRELVLTPDHDGVLVADVVAEWTGRYAPSGSLNLGGPAGGRWTFGPGEELSLDAVEFCRIVSGRPPAGDGPESSLRATQVPF